LWGLLGHRETVFQGGWPAYDEAATHLDEVEYVVQIGGKVRARMRLPAGLTQAEAEPLILASPALTKWLEGQSIIKKVFVPDKLMNLTVRPA
jgi:leucyl-tRNA synthetase